MTRSVVSLMPMQSVVTINQGATAVAARLVGGSDFESATASKLRSGHQANAACSATSAGETMLVFFPRDCPELR